MFLQYTAWQPVSPSAGLCVVRLNSPERPIACPLSRRSHSRFWTSRLVIMMMIVIMMMVVMTDGDNDDG